MFLCFMQADVLTVMGVSGSNNAMETEQPNTNKKYYIDTNSVCVARENMDITTLIKDSMSKHNNSCISSAQRLYSYMYLLCM